MRPLEDQLLGTFLLRRGVISQDDLAKYSDSGSRTSFVEWVVSSNFATEKEMARILAEEFEVGFVEMVDSKNIPLELIQPLPIAFAKQHRIFPIEENEKNIFCILSNPFDTQCIDDIRNLYQKEVVFAISTHEVVLDTINRVWERRENSGAELESEDRHEEDQLVDIIDSDDDAPIIAWVNSLFALAVRERASDIHIEPEEREVIVRFRIDGELYVKRQVSKQFMPQIIARVKIMSSLNIAEKRLPQDGRITLKIAGKSVDIRVSTVPTSRGFERIVMRILHKSSALLGLDDLGFSEREYALMDSLITRPDGIILVTGPTGSGKTTTLYACLNRINDPSRNILTAEDPVEYEIGGIHQVHVQSAIGLTFANALRSFLRQDPDVIMVGEIRDKETAEIAIHASLTGHLVLSTIHTNDAAAAVTRLVEMDIEPFLVRSSVIGILAQRLVRMLCPQCKIPYKPFEYELSQLGLDKDRVKTRSYKPPNSRYYLHNLAQDDFMEKLIDPVFFKPGGCDACLQKGFVGRRGIYELLVMDEAVGGLILKNADAHSIKRAAMNQGMGTMREDGARKVLLGLTTVEEVLAATQEDVLVDDYA